MTKVRCQHCEAVVLQSQAVQVTKGTWLCRDCVRSLSQGE